MNIILGMPGGFDNVITLVLRIFFLIFFFFFNYVPRRC